MSRELLHPKARAMLDEMQSADRPDSSKLPIEEARANLERLFAGLGPGPDVERTFDRTIPGPAGEIPVRFLRGAGARDGGPLVVYLHGGGHAQGSIATSDALCRGLANACRATVMNVEYRLAPEHPFPAAYEDALAAVRWALAHADEVDADPAAVVVGGDSAGGNLTLAVCATIEQPRRIAAQLMIYPLGSVARQAELYDETFDDFFLNFAELEHFKALYVPAGTDLGDPRLSPLDAPSLAGLPPAVVVAAQCDPIHPQAEAIHARLTAEGVPAKLLVYPGMIHGFYGMTSLFDAAQQAFDDVAAELHTILGAATRS